MVTLFVLLGWIIGVLIGFQLSVYTISMAISRLMRIDNSGIEFNSSKNTVTFHMDKMNTQELRKILLENKTS